MSTPRYLTKSRFKLAVECPTKLYYANKKDIYKDNMAENEFLAMLAEGGYQVGELAKYYFPGGVEVKVQGNKHSEAEALTANYLKQDEVILFEPAIRVGDYFVRIDVLVKKGNQFELIEVKSKSYDSENPEIEGKKVYITSGYLPYIQDVAFQKWVLQQAFPQSTISTYLMMPNKAKKASINGINQIFKINADKTVTTTIPAGVNLEVMAKELLEKVPVDDYSDYVLNSELKYPGGPSLLEDAAAKWAEAYKVDSKIPPVIGAHCGKCQFKATEDDHLKSGFHECWKEANNWSDKDFEEGTILDLWNSKNKEKYIQAGKLKLAQLTRDDLKESAEEAGTDGLSQSQRQRLQIEDIPGNYDQGGFYLDKSLIAHQMSAKWQFPYHMIDFETASVALPFYKNMRPYQSIAFQFSHHIINEDGSVEHVGEFLCADPGDFPNYKFVRALKKELEHDDGTVFMWSHHENTILTSILGQLDEDVTPPEDAEDLKVFIRSITKEGPRAMVDLCDLAKKAYYHPETKGSNSIKKVLPAVLKTSQKLMDLYSKPIYGASGGITSSNFASPAGFTWLTKDNHDPYQLLKQYAKDLMPEGLEDTEEGEASLIAEGGAAATAYSRLQFENLSLDARNRIKAALLRYCETDTLAMVMVMQAWQEGLDS